MAWWDDIWLNEAFATWMAAKIVDQLEARVERAVERAADALERDGRRTRS